MMFKAQSTQKINYDRSAKPTECKLGDTVYLKRSALGLTEDPKLRPMYSGPYIIQRFLSPTNVILSDVKTNNKLPRSFHINKLKRIFKRKKTLVQDNEGDTKGTSDNEVNKPLELPQRTAPEKNLALPESVLEDRVSMPSRTVFMPPIMPEEIDNVESHRESGSASQEEHREEHREATDDLPESIIDNAPTEESKEEVSENIEENNDNNIVYYPIHKIHRKRLNPEGEREYYVSWKNRPKRDNCWIEEDNFTEELKNRANTLKIPETQYRY